MLGLTLTQEGIQFKQGSVMVDGKHLDTANPGTGIPLGQLNPGQTVRVTFAIKVVKVPAKRKVSNTAQATFRPQGANQNFHASSKVVFIRIHEHEE